MRRLYTTLAVVAAAALTLPAAASAEDLVVGMPTNPFNIVHMPVAVAQEIGRASCRERVSLSV